MESKSLSEIFTSILSSLRPHIFPMLIACTGLLLIGYGLITSFVPDNTSSDISFEARGISVKKMDVKDDEKGKIAVDVSGSVGKPGVYRLLENARVEDAIIASGGFSADADFDWTQRSLNLAAKVTDGMKIYIPRVGESSPAGGGSSTSVIAGASTNSLVSINTASSSELEDLPGIGPVSAGKIIDNRPYGSIEELLSKKAVGKSTFEKIKALISL